MATKSWRCGWRSTVPALLVGGMALLSGGSIGAQDWRPDDFRWMHGANYVASYAATDVEMWLRYDHAVIDRELGYARKLGLNCVRVFLQSLVYHHAPKAFLARFEDFLATADKHGLKVMPILFDSCFGVAPSLESRHIWVANPGPDRMGKEWWPESDAYATAVVSAHVGDKRIALWDVMNEPTATHLAGTREGKTQIDAFVAHYCALVKKLDSTHAITVGIATGDNRDVLPLVDVLSCHSYATGVEAFRQELTGTQNQARAAGKPWIVSECCNPAAGSTYEMALPVLRELGVGHTVWQLIIGRDQFNAASGLVYPDGTVRRLAQVEAVMNAPATGFTEKPDEQGLPIRHDIPVLQAKYLEACLKDGVTEVTWRERVTLVESLLALPGGAIPEVQAAREATAAARKAYDAGDRKTAFATMAGLIEKAAAPLRANPPQPAPPFPLKATVYRDVYGIPHIFADSEETEAEQLDAVKALRAAADDLKKTFGSPLVPWGQVLRLRRGDLDLPLDGDVGFFGGVECLRATGTQNKDKTGRFVFDGGQVIPTVVELTDPIQAWSIVPYGQSRRGESRHYADQAHLYSEGRLRPAWHTWSQLRDHVESVKVFEYGPKKTSP